MAEQNKKNKKLYDIEYLKQNQKRVSLNWLKDDFENTIEPAIRRSGLPISTFIKDAVREKLNRDGLMDANAHPANE